jgi:DNA-binding NtrC family response regulator
MKSNVRQSVNNVPSALIREPMRIAGERGADKRQLPASREAEKEIILCVLTRTRRNRRRAAEQLQISYKALLYKLKQMGCSEYRAS